MPLFYLTEWHFYSYDINISNVFIKIILIFWSILQDIMRIILIYYFKTMLLIKLFGRISLESI